MLARDIIEKGTERHQKHLSEGGKETLSAVVKPIQEKFIELQNQMNKFYGDEREQLGQLDKELEKLFPQPKPAGEAKHYKRLERRIECKATGASPIERILEQVGLAKAFTIRSNRRSGMRRHTDRISSSTPDDKVLIIDSKVSLTAYERMTQADDPTVIEQERTARCECFRTHQRVGQKLRRTLRQEHRLHPMFMPVEASWVALTNTSCGCRKRRSAKTSCSFQPAP